MASNGRIFASQGCVARMLFAFVEHLPEFETENRPMET